MWGECPAQCQQHQGDPDCCAPTCPPQCTNKRGEECARGGVVECAGVAGCCPEHFHTVYT